MNRNWPKRERGRPMDKEKRILKKILLSVLGSVILVLGITLILVWWNDVVRLFKGASGMVLALGGLMILFLIRE